jgi:hypothetical protein
MPFQCQELDLCGRRHSDHVIIRLDKYGLIYLLTDYAILTPKSRFMWQAPLRLYYCTGSKQSTTELKEEERKVGAAYNSTPVN